MTKKVAILIIIISTMLLSETVYGEDVSVSIPEFKVTINGHEMDNVYNQYPFIVYKDITYYPMAYDYARFLGLKSNWYKTERQKGVLFIGVAENPTSEFKKYATTTPNKKYYTATIADYNLAVNTISTNQFLKNNEEPYPILNFRNVTYFPLTWRFAVEEFGWTYSWNIKDGLKINSSNPFRPVINDKILGYTLPVVNRKEYFYGTDYYVGYSTSTLENNYDIVIRKRGEEEKIYNIKDQLKPANYYFNDGTTLTGSIPDSILKKYLGIEENVFSVICKVDNDPNDNILLKINIETGQVISQEPFTLE